MSPAPRLWCTIFADRRRRSGSASRSAAKIALELGAAIISLGARREHLDDNDRIGNFERVGGKGGPQRTSASGSKAVRYECAPSRRRESPAWRLARRMASASDIYAFPLVARCRTRSGDIATTTPSCSSHRPSRPSPQARNSSTPSARQRRRSWRSLTHGAKRKTPLALNERGLWHSPHRRNGELGAFLHARRPARSDRLGLGVEAERVGPCWLRSPKPERFQPPKV